MSSVIVEIPYLSDADKFDGTNWAIFKLYLMAHAKARGLDKYLLGKIPRPTALPDTETTTSAHQTSWWGAINPTRDEWEQRDNIAKALIIFNVKNPIGMGLTIDGTAEEAWKTLANEYDGISTMHHLEAENELRAIQYVEGTSMDTHIAKLRSSCAKANARGAGIKDPQFRFIVIQSMPKSWTTFISTLFNCKSTVEVISRLSHFVILSKGDDEPSRPTNISTNSQVGNNGPRRPDLKCSNENCGRSGHTIETCFKPGGGMEGQHPHWWRA